MTLDPPPQEPNGPLVDAMALTVLLATRSVALGHARRQYTPETCPAAAYDKYLDYPGHAAIAQMLTGLGCWVWECPFCGECFEE